MYEIQAIKLIKCFHALQFDSLNTKIGFYFLVAVQKNSLYKVRVKKCSKFETQYSIIILATEHYSDNQ